MDTSPIESITFLGKDRSEEFEDRLKWKYCKLCQVQMATTMSTSTHVQGKRHRQLLAVNHKDGIEENFIEKGSLPTLKAEVRQKPNKPCSFSCVEDLASTFDDLIKCAKWMDRRFPPCYASASKKSPKTCNMIYSKYANLPGAFRPRMTPSGLWEYKHCYLNEGRTKPEQGDVMLPAGGETEGAFHLLKISGISGSAVNGTRFVGSSHWKIPRKSGKSKKVVPFSRLEFPNGISCSIYVSRSLYQFQVHGRAPPCTGVYDQMEQLFTNRKFHFCYHRNFRVFFLNGKRPENVYIASADLVLDKNPFDSGATCRMFKGSLKRNSVSLDVACKEYLLKMTYKYKRRIEKEVKCLVKLKHSNVLQHFGWDFERSMLVTEFLCKEVRLGGGEIECVHNARQLLDTLEGDLPWTHRLDIVQKACSGLQYLHENGIVHCDVKAANIFIGGGKASEYVVKFGDFGQANFDFGQFSQTQYSSFVSTGSSSERNQVGTAPYTAPELIELGAKRNFPSDVYSMGMVMIEFTLPERSHPWEGEVSSSDLIFHHVRQGKRPTIIPSKPSGLDGDVKQDWLNTIKKCLDQDPDKRPPIPTVTRVLENMTTKGDVQSGSLRNTNERFYEGVTIEDIPLNVHQGTVVESAGEIAASLYEQEGITEDVEAELEASVRRLDGTNACVFLAVKNVDNILSSPSSLDDTTHLKEQVENAIRTLPEEINSYREINKYSNMDEALQLLKESNLIRHRYNATEMIQDQLCTSREHKRTHLRNELLALAADSPSLAIYTCTPVSLVVGFVGNTFLIIDTHCISFDLGGNGNAIIRLVRCNGNVQNGGESVLDWLEKRISSSVGPDKGRESLIRLTVQEADDIEKTYFSDGNDDDDLLLSVSEDFDGTFGSVDDEDDYLIASVPEPDESSAKNSHKVVHESPISSPDHTKKPDVITVKQESNDFSTKLWEYPTGRLAHNESAELLWKGHLTTFQLTSFKRFQLDAIRAIEAKKDVVVIQKTGSGKSICFQVPSVFDSTKTTVVICPTISLIHSQVESLKAFGINAIAIGPQHPVEMMTIGGESEASHSLIYTTPEYFATKLKHRLSSLSKRLKLIVIDEVHKVFDRNSEFRSSYDTLRFLHDDFPGIPIMALTATLNEEQLNLLCENYLRQPVLIKSTVDRPNIKLNVGKYQTKRPVKGDKSLVWMDTSRQIRDLLADEYGIVYIDFKRDVELMLTCLKESCALDARAYHGGLSHQEKMEVDSQFRNKDFQLLVATESYEVGTHSPHVQSVVRLGCMRNLGVLIQEFGRAGRGGEQADGYLFFNECKDDQRLTYWTMGCSSDEVERIKKSYEDSWRWIYGIYNRTCLRETLRRSYEDTTVILDQTEGECCSSCDIEQEKDFNAREPAILLLTAIKDLQEILSSNEGVNEDNLVSWLVGAKRDWISKPEIQTAIDKSSTFGKGEQLGNNRSWWSRHLRQLISVKLVEMNFKIIRTPQFSTTARKFKVSTEGQEFLRNPSDLVVLSPSIDPFEKRKKAPSDNKKHANREGRALHHLPKIRNALSSSDKWSEMKKEDYEYPGFSQSSKDIAYCKNIKEMKGFGSHQRPHFMWDDNQLSKRHTTTKKCQIKIEGKNTEITLRRAPCEGIKVCSFPDCTYAVSNRQKQNRCKSHAKTHKLKMTGPCPAQIMYAWPTNDDGRRWMGIVPDPDLKHNHSKPAPHRISQEVKCKIGAALKKDTSLTTKDLQKGCGIGIIPGEVSPAAANAERVRRERSRILSTTSTTRKELMPLLKILDFEKIREKVEKEQDSTDSEFSGKVNEMMGKYQMESVEYLFKPGRKYAFFMSPYQCELLGEAEELFSDITFTGNDDFPYLLNLVIFNKETLSYQAVARVLCDKQDGESYGLSFHEVFKQATKVNSNFNHGKSLRQIVVDFDDAEYNGFTRVLGKDITEKLLRGCSVHWKRSVNRVAKIVCQSKDEELIFKSLAGNVEDAKEKEEVIEIFEILSGRKSLLSAIRYVPEKLKQICNDPNEVSNAGWKRLKHWANWWTRPRHLHMFTKAFTSRDADDWDGTSNTTNPVESINRQSFKSKNNLNVILENIYLEDRIHAVKMVARSQDVNISYSVTNKKRQNRKRKRTSLVVDPETHTTLDANGPPDKAKDIRAAKRARRRGKELINSMVEVEYKEKKEDGNFSYLGWLRSTIAAYNSRLGYLVQFQNQFDCNGNETGDWTDWLPSMNCSDVKIIE